MKLHEEWLFKAEQDITSAEYLMTSENKLGDIAIFHAQQGGEKALKAYLVYKEVTAQKTHNLVYLCQIARKMDDSFSTLLDAALLLNPYATLFRYPESELLPDDTELKKAIDAAKFIYTFIKKKLS